MCSTIFTYDSSSRLVLLYLLFTHIATAVALAEQGCNILLADTIGQTDKLDAVAVACHDAAKSTNILIESYHCDVTNSLQVKDAIASADKLATRASVSSSTSANEVASILVNCAGITRDAKLAHLSNEHWDSVLNVNLKGTFLMCQQFCEPNRLKSLLRPMGGTGGSIINIGSIVSTYGNVGQINYAASKGGVVGLTKALAKEMALLSWQTATATGGVNAGRERDKDNDDIIIETCIPPTIRVNCIQPGFINTPMVDAVSKKVIAEMTSKIALRRLGRVEDVANLVLFLASNDRSGYITGESFECSGMLRI